MNEADARAWVMERFPQAVEKLERLIGLVAQENDRQNLIAPSTLSEIWNRHVADSLQLVTLAGDDRATWLDIGTGGGFPGLAAATVWHGPMLLVEPRRRRAEFLTKAAHLLCLSNVEVRCDRVERLSSSADVVSARAVASVKDLVAMGRSVASRSARWLLPRGQVSDEERQYLRGRGIVFHVEQSVTNEGSQILVLEGVGRQ